MVENDTIRLLRECDAGVKMGVSSIDDVLDKVHSKELREKLNGCKDRHEILNDEIKKLLTEYGDEGKNPAPIAKGMSWIKTNIMLEMDKSDSKIADLITDGCNMGVKSLYKYLNEYKAADDTSKELALALIKLEENLGIDMREYL